MRITRGWPSSNWPKYVAVGSTRAPVTHDERTAPSRVRESVRESYILDVILWQLAENQFTVEAQQACVTSVFAIYRALDGALRASADEFTLGRLVTWARFVDFKPDDFWLEEGRAAQIVTGLKVDVHRL